jgi:hypothetical protein
MNLNRMPLITKGQVYLNSDLNQYLVVTKVVGDSVWYQGTGFYGQSCAFQFVERFQPVDPVDLSKEESKSLVENTKLVPADLKVGFIVED